MLLYDSGLSGNCYKVRLLLAHLGRDYERRELSVIDRSDRNEILGELNPGLRVPTLVFDDGRVLAEDVERFNISVHYRWLEDPPNEHWLTKQALSRLSRAERRNRVIVEAQRQKIRARRDLQGSAGGRRLAAIRYP